MRLKFIIGILALLLLMVGTASAEDIPFVMDEENDDYRYGVDIKVQVNYDSTVNTMTFTVIEPKNKQYPDYLISNVNLLSIWIKTDPKNVKVIDPEGWGTPTAIQKSIGNFGHFDTEIRTKDENIKYAGPVTIQLLNGVTLDSLREDAGSDYVAAAHVAFEKSGEKGVIGCSGKVRGYTPIPEFSTIALPIAAILGLMFIFGRKKQE